MNRKPFETKKKELNIYIYYFEKIYLKLKKKN
jgi:hypothetical protein